jgi:hypothetical protein
MRRILSLSTVMLALSLSSLLAQTEKGTIMTGIGFQPRYQASAHRNGQKTFRATGDIKAGYFIKNNWLIGGELGLSYFSRFNASNQGLKTSGYSIGLMGRKYFDLKNPKWKPFVELSAGYGQGKLEYRNLSFDPGFPSSSESFYAKSEYGIAYFINEKIGINAAHFTRANLYQDSFNTFSGFKFGINLFINGNKKE